MFQHRSSYLSPLSHAPPLSGSFRSFSVVPTTLALVTSLFILFYISLTSSLFRHPNHNSFLLLHGPSDSRPSDHHFIRSSPAPDSQSPHSPAAGMASPFHIQDRLKSRSRRNLDIQARTRPIGKNSSEEVFHDKRLFLEDYEDMKRKFKIFVYPHEKNEPYSHVLLPVDFEPSGNYASESYFKMLLLKSHFITKDPSEADFFFLPFSIARLRHDPLVGVGGIQDFVKMYISNISQNYPYWNRSGGADHFYVTCHSTGRMAMEKALEVKFNAIQVVCSSSYFLSGYIAHKDASLPQIWPRKGEPPHIDPAERKTLAFFAGSLNSPVREKLLQSWRNDPDISVHRQRLNTPYSDLLLHSKFCLHVKGYEVNTARIGDALYYGCVPVVIANHYDLPFADILNWKSFSIVVATLDIPLLKKILRGVSSDKYAFLQRNVMKVRRHFQWHLFPVDYDAFYMVMYELWLRRSSVRIPITSSNFVQWERNTSNMDSFNL